MDFEEIQKIMNSEEFFYFVNNEFERTAIHASVEELAQFAFGSPEEAINEFMKEKSL